MSILQSMLSEAKNTNYHAKSILQNSVLPSGKSLIFQDTSSQMFKDEKLNVLKILSENGLIVGSRRVSIFSDHLHISSEQDFKVHTAYIHLKSNLFKVDSDDVEFNSKNTQIKAEDIIELNSKQNVNINGQNKVSINSDKDIEISVKDKFVNLDENGLIVKTNTIFSEYVTFEGKTVFDHTESFLIKTSNNGDMLKIEQNDTECEKPLIHLSQNNKDGTFIKFEGESITNSNTGNIIDINESIDSVIDTCFIKVKVKDLNKKGVDDEELYIKLYKVK